MKQAAQVRRNFKRVNSLRNRSGEYTGGKVFDYNSKRMDSIDTTVAPKADFLVSALLGRFEMQTFDGKKLTSEIPTRVTRILWLYGDLAIYFHGDRVQLPSDIPEDRVMASKLTESLWYEMFMAEWGGASKHSPSVGWCQTYAKERVRAFLGARYVEVGEHGTYNADGTVQLLRAFHWTV